MYKGLRVAVVVPAYNEERLVGRTITTVPDFVDHIVVVDDLSTDGTSGCVLAISDPRVVLIQHEVNQGVGGAIVTGHRRALELGADVNVVMAGDNQMDPAYLSALLDPIADAGYRFTKANRFTSRASLAGMPRVRLIGSVLLSFATKAASGYWHLFDPQNGYTAIHRDALLRLNLDGLAKRYEFENDLLINLNILNVRACDVPIPAVYGDETSTMKLRHVVPRLTALLIKGFWKRILLKYVLLSFSPIALLLFSGLALCLFGTVVGIWVIWQTLGPPVASAGSVLLAVAPMLTGIHLLVSALVLDIQESPR